ncbi:MAG: hypothetical protein P8N02_17740, partial [Actinomycetota bacterium]|nr:hypothetical protein [Actinomycetota bacterium]
MIERIRAIALPTGAVTLTIAAVLGFGAAPSGAALPCESVTASPAAKLVKIGILHLTADGTLYVLRDDRLYHGPYRRHTPCHYSGMKALGNTGTVTSIRFAPSPAGPMMIVWTGDFDAAALKLMYEE